MKRSLLVVGFGLAVACGSDPPPKSANDANDSSSSGNASSAGSSSGGASGGGSPQMSQELGSIDQRGVEVMTNDLLNGKLETSCHKSARDRLEYLTGDVKMFFRITQAGKVKYAYFEDSNLGDRDTEKCIMDAFLNAPWPKPVGGEAEVHNGFGWTAGGERAPAAWTSDRVLGALDKDKAAKDAVAKCTGGASGGFKVTGYVEEGDVEGKGADADAPKPEPKKGGKKGSKADKKKAAEAELEHGGRFKAVGVSVINKDNAEKIDCLSDALKTLSLPSPGSYVAKVTFSL